MSVIEGHNGTQHEMGELRGDIRALIRQFELMATEFQAMKHAVNDAQREIGEHVAFHLGREKQLELQRINTRWWMGTMMAGCGIMAGLIVKFWV